jgi:integrase
MLVSEFESEFIEFCKSPAASRRGANKESSIENKSNDLRRYIVPVLGDREIAEIDNRTVDRFIMKLSAKGLSPNTIGNVLITLQRMVAVAHRWGLRDAPLVIDAARKARRDMIEADAYLSERETTRLLGVSETTKHYPLLLLAARAGLRFGELLALHWEDLDLFRGVVIVRRSWYRDRMTTTKGNRAREVPLTEVVCSALRKQPRRSHLVFPGSIPGRPVARSPITEAVMRAGHRADLVKADGTPKRVSPHMLRHTWASWCLRRGVPIAVVQRWGGWQSIEMLERYSHLASREALEFADRLTDAGMSGR